MGKGSDAGVVGAWLESVLARLSVDDVPAPWKQNETNLVGGVPGRFALVPVLPQLSFAALQLRNLAKSFLQW